MFIRQLTNRLLLVDVLSYREPAAFQRAVTNPLGVPIHPVGVGSTRVEQVEVILEHLAAWRPFDPIVRLEEVAQRDVEIVLPCGERR